MFIPRRNFQMGSAPLVNGRFSSEGPLHHVYTDAFYIHAEDRGSKDRTQEKGLLLAGSPASLHACQPRAFSQISHQVIVGGCKTAYSYHITYNTKPLEVQWQIKRKK